MRLVLSWLRDFVDVSASAAEVAEMLGHRGFEVASIERVGDDDVIDFEVTANRPDALSVIGLAREAATAWKLPLRLPSEAAGARIALQPLAGGASPKIAVRIEDEDLCPRYAAAVAEVTPASSPAWMTARLHAAGVRPISAIVDITNYVLIELGQPTHAFDAAKLAGGEIRVRRARPGEVVRTLDGVERKLEPDMLVIADRDRAQAVAGVMGGADSEISASTQTVVFESACFKASSVRRTSKRLGLKTEASFRFERGGDVGGPVTALQRIAALMAQIGVGRVVEPIVDVYPAPRTPAVIHLRRARLASLLGVSVPDAEVERILPALGLQTTRAADGWDVAPPTFRVDVLREADLIEEVGRHYGFDKLDAAFPEVRAAAPPPDPRVPRDRLVRDVLRASGLSEAVTFGFIEAKLAALFLVEGASPPMTIANPLNAKFDTLRPSVIPGLVDAVAHNRRHGREDVRLFEIATRFRASGETRAVALAWTGGAAPVHWSVNRREVDFFDVKGAVDAVCDALHVPVTYEPASEPFLVAGQTARVLAAGGPASGTTLGIVGRLTPVAADARGLPRQDAVFVAEIDLDALDAARAPAGDATRPLPRHPFVVRDLSIVVADALPAAIIHGTIQAAARDVPAPLADATFFDRYQGKGVPEGRVSVSVRLTFQADRTLTDAEVQRSVDAILAALVRDHGAVQR